MKLASLILSIFIFSFLPQGMRAQTISSDPNVILQSGLGQGEVRESGLLVLQFGTTGMTESAAKAYANLIAQNLTNTKRFRVTSPDESEQVIMNEAPQLLPCFDVGCGMQMAQIMGSERVLSGHITLTDSGVIRLSVKMVNAKDNSLEFEDEIRFMDETMDQRFYQLSQRIASNTPLKGLVLEANNKIAVISLGANDGIRVGDTLVVYRNLSVKSETLTSLVDNSRRNNIAILAITKVGDRSSEGTYFQTIETPKSGHFVITYLAKDKQIDLVQVVRREMDTHLRNVFEIEEEVVIAPIALEDLDKKQWILDVRRAEAKRDYFQTWLAGSGAAAALVLYQFGQANSDVLLIASIGALAYSSYEYFGARGRVKALVEEGKFKGYLDYNFDPESGAMGINYTLHF